jgi:4-aminobutyrate aminotransferase/diaminobutyrate-pyruvate transaminase/4-aminobutyrate aminotransferase/(S)-3-amino-2-methylpropionate transaminase
MSRPFSLEPRPVATVHTSLRRIVTPIPPPESLAAIGKLHKFEPVAVECQPPVVWDRAEGFQVWDAYGNCWIDWSSGVLVANAGHGRREVIEAITAQASTGLLHNFCFPSEIRGRLAERLVGLLPDPLKKVFLLTTGSEAVECAIKLCRLHGVKAGGRGKHIIVSFENAFHGRTLGAQQAGGIPALKEWIVNLDKGFVQVPFPDGFHSTDTNFDAFLKTLSDAGCAAPNVAGVILETYQGGSASFAPVEYIQQLRRWTASHKILLACDEVQAGFGRTGRFWAFEHYGIVPDLVAMGKGISSSLPLSAIAGSAAVMDLPATGTLTSSHAGNPVSCAAALAAIDLIVNEGLVEHARQMGERLHRRLREMKARFPQIGCVAGAGLVAGVACVKPHTKEPDEDLAWNVVRASMEKGVLMFSPVGFGGATVKIAPPLTITADAIDESCGAFEEAFAESVQARVAATS